MEKEEAETLVTVNFGDAMEHSALSSALRFFNMVDIKEHTFFINPALVVPFKKVDSLPNFFR